MKSLYKMCESKINVTKLKNQFRKRSKISLWKIINLACALYPHDNIVNKKIKCYF